MKLKNVTNSIRDSFIDLHYHCDLVEINSLSKGEISYDERDLLEIYSKEQLEKDEYLVDLFPLLLSRAEYYGDDYPFEVNYEGKSITRKVELTTKHRFYIFLLLCSMNEKVKHSEGYGKELESAFEHVSVLAFSNRLIDVAHVHHFGSSSYSEERYTGTLIEKINLLASDIKCRTMYDPDDFHSQDRGDGGLDLVAWVPFDNDEYLGSLEVYLGQCTISRTTWHSKQSDVENFKEQIDFPSSTRNIMFVPHDLRTINNRIRKNKRLSDIIFDRRRIMICISDDDLTSLFSEDVFIRLNKLINSSSNN